MSLDSPRPKKSFIDQLHEAGPDDLTVKNEFIAMLSRRGTVIKFVDGQTRSVYKYDSSGKPIVTFDNLESKLVDSLWMRRGSIAEITPAAIRQSTGPKAPAGKKVPDETRGFLRSLFDRKG